MSDLNLFPSRLKEARIKADISQKELSRRTGIAPATLSSYESTENFKNPTIDKVAAIADALNISIDWLCGIDENESRTSTFTIKQILECIVTLISDDAFYYSEPCIVLEREWESCDFAKAVSNLMEVHRSNPNALPEELYKTCIDKLICDYTKTIKENRLRMEKFDKINKAIAAKKAGDSNGEH